MRASPAWRQRLRLADQFSRGFDAIYMTGWAAFHEQVVNDNPRWTARAVIRQRQVGLVRQHLVQQRFDEVDSDTPVQLASAVLIEFAVRVRYAAPEQLDGLVGFDLGRGHVVCALAEFVFITSTVPRATA